MADSSPSAGGPHMAEATETLIYSSWMVPLPSLNPSLHRDFSLANYWARRLQTTMSGRDFPSEQSSEILRKVRVHFDVCCQKHSSILPAESPPLPPIHLVEYRSTAAATARSKRQNTFVWCLLMSPLQQQPFYHHKSHKDLHSLQIQQSWGWVSWKKVLVYLHLHAFYFCVLKCGDLCQLLHPQFFWGGCHPNHCPGQDKSNNQP